MKCQRLDASGPNLSRREFLALTTLTGTAVATGCATNPVTGRRQMMFISPETEIKMDQQHSPHQFSADYGAIQDARLQSYLQDLTLQMAKHTHRPEMPYHGVGLNASYVNGYIFPGGSMGITRGLLAQMEDEATLAALIGHELGHVNARHAASRMTSSMLAMLVVAGVGIAVAVKKEDYAPLVIGLGGIGAGALLARYSRNDERQADELGMEYMVRTGYTPQGMVDLMDVLRRLNDRKPNVVEMMFASHPMSRERYRTASRRSRDDYASALSLPSGRERYMDMTATLRAQAPMLDHLQDGDTAMRGKKFDQAEKHYRSALKVDESDYESLMKLSKSLLAQEKVRPALTTVRSARAGYPEEPQSYQLGGIIALGVNEYEQAHQDFEHYGRVLPGNPLTDFHHGRALEGLNRKEEAADRYKRFLKQVSSGQEADYARKKLTEWGMEQTST